MFIDIAIAAFMATNPVPSICIAEAAPAISAKYEAGKMTKSEALMAWEDCIYFESETTGYTES